MKYINLKEKYSGYGISQIGISETGETLIVDFLGEANDNVKAALIAVFPDYPNIKKLELETSRLSDLSILKPFQGLREIYLHPGFGGYGDWSLSSSVRDVSPLKNLPRLESLTIDFAGDDLTSFATLTQIRDLSVRIDALNPDLEAIGKLVQLEKLSLAVTISRWSRNRIDSIAQLGGLVNLKSLSVGGLGLKSIAPVKRMLALQYLDCSNNFIRSIKLLEKLSELRELNLSGNKSLRDVSVLSKLKKLEKVDFSETGADPSATEPSNFF